VRDTSLATARLSKALHAVSGFKRECGEGFTDLHTRAYGEILVGSGYDLEDAKPAVAIASNIHRSGPVGLQGDYHRMLKKAR
jgi:hypothetical protein